MENAARNQRNSRIRELSGGVLQQLYLTSKLFSLYRHDHANTQEGFDQLYVLLRSFFQHEEALNIVVDRGYVFVNGVRIRGADVQGAATEWFTARVVESGLKHLSFRSEVTEAELKAFVPLLLATNWETGAASAPDLPSQLKEGRIEHVQLDMRRFRTLKEEEEAEQRESVDPRNLAIAIYEKICATVRSLVHTFELGLPLNLRASRLLVVLAADFLREEEGRLLGFLTLRPRRPTEEDYLSAHVADVAILALAVGRRLELTRRQLLDLGCAALAYDLGMAKVPERVRRSPGFLSFKNRETLAGHPGWSARALLASGDQTQTTYQAAMVAAEHHRGPEYPKLVQHEVALSSDIISVVDAYDALTTPRPWRRRLRPDEALQTLADKPEVYDPCVVRALAAVLGAFPPGTILELDTSEVGIVVGAAPLGSEPASEALWRPHVRLLTRPAKGEDRSGDVVSLLEPAKASGYVRTAKRVLTPDTLNLTLTELLTLL